jgi:hypothetical protein
MKKLGTLAPVCAAIVLAAGMAAADDPGSPGVARSMNFLALSPDAVVTVRPFDNTRANLALKQKFAAALKKRSVHVDDAAAPYVLNFETEVAQTIRRPTSALASGWSATQDRGTLRYVLTATLEEERTGRRLWQGEASYAGAPADEATTLAAMAAVLAGQVGQTVRQKNFRIE